MAYKTVLYIEDDPDSVVIMEGALASAGGVRFCAATTGKEGLALAAKMQPELIILDINLPDMNGYDVLAALKGSGYTSVPVIAYTALASIEEKQRGMAAGFSAYLTKPLNIKEFISTVERLLAPRPHPSPPPKAG